MFESGATHESVILPLASTKGAELSAKDALPVCPDAAAAGDCVDSLEQAPKPSTMIVTNNATETRLPIPHSICTFNLYSLYKKPQTHPMPRLTGHASLGMIHLATANSD